ncbi:MAG: GTP 3',8-cyclase MoaA [Myxococcales bacterium]|nr:GTP 3',8-cyclase MoaA [Myxococcales bacterium]
MKSESCQTDTDRRDGVPVHLPILSEKPLPVGALGVSAGPLIDGLARRIRYVRISLTDRCNYRCTYCMPDEGIELAPRADVLSFEELEATVRALQTVGVERVRLTGGEPTVRKDLIELVTRLGRLGLQDLALSTNGERLAELALPLRRAGLHRLNVSVDTLKPDRFAQVTRRGNLANVLAGLDAARAAGFAYTKLNCVAMRGFNDDELGALCRYAWDRDMIPRFIELMPMAEGQLFYPGTFLSVAEQRKILTAELGPLLSDAPDAESALPGVGPARYALVRYAGSLRKVGLISAVSEPFCDTCNRVRLSATGQLHACLAYDDAIDLRRVLRSGLVGDALLDRLVQAARGGLSDKRASHVFSESGCGGPRKHMVSIGG